MGCAGGSGAGQSHSLTSLGKDIRDREGSEGGAGEEEKRKDGRREGGERREGEDKQRRGKCPLLLLGSKSTEARRT